MGFNSGFKGLMSLQATPSEVFGSVSQLCTDNTVVSGTD